MGTHFENMIRLNIQRLADLKRTTAELERELFDTRVSLERELVQSACSHETAAGQIQETCHCALHDIGRVHDADRTSVPHAAQNTAPSYESSNSSGPEPSPEGRAAALVNHGRRSVYKRRLSSYGRKVAAGTAVSALLVTVLVMIISRGGASWPSSVAIVQREISKACQNPDVKSEPGQVNFACGTTTRQILWVFALMTSADNSNFADTKTGRIGLEPITPAQGGEIASSLNLHHPYDPSNPIDSIEVAARAINNIIGGATLTGTEGNPVVQAGLDSDSANCVRYTGSAAIILRQGFPNLCARPVTSQVGQAALVADVYRKWVVGAATKAAQDAAVLFENAKNPGDPRVQIILKHLPNSRPAA